MAEPATAFEQLRRNSLNFKHEVIGNRLRVFVEPGMLDQLDGELSNLTTHGFEGNITPEGHRIYTREQKHGGIVGWFRNFFSPNTMEVKLIKGANPHISFAFPNKHAVTEGEIKDFKRMITAFAIKAERSENLAARAASNERERIRHQLGTK
ncbi:hypothetical protein COX86_03805 [Candidatus Micrarchaeota archaeon CG_4_10_14_0_2_um_filter_60_11]|nr:MAG: hypothetical protein AUJ16_02300 [Candidatus Micrarchaeota archaeon CG1_02_60_51]PIN96577.1 MAG: hypothetical protein COU39_00535 [Candidatus Micrarchaeota archaeon CG10_big_fil_rev_8_21_14_0_10_60_32]PIO02198.1 MAG: hypothetical protein COT58_01320 [Candidatus Micrarchaeota archaeon CG09_land_8_20_14_0_10_60_16]PIY91651.1 MAG: hypothetical protein COY71_02050 [Candidatus Micrarchaeota archaeon CG_4_10_14_0_8_um_filter_60_7]PIZ90667.1 MAG: hypothetical protein COX86_03805 [Candidatus Mi